MLTCREPWPDRGTSSSLLLLSWGVPLSITVAAVALKKIGYDASDVSVGWCWIDLEAEDRVLWMLLTGKLWEMLAYVLLPLLYLLVRKHINRAVGVHCAGPWGTGCISGDGTGSGQRDHLRTTYPARCHRRVDRVVVCVGPVGSQSCCSSLSR